VPGNDTLPADMAEMRQTCIDTNPDFEHKVRPPCPSSSGYCCRLDLR
jgi:hypothetical protein